MDACKGPTTAQVRYVWNGTTAYAYIPPNELPNVTFADLADELGLSADTVPMNFPAAWNRFAERSTDAICCATYRPHDAVTVTLLCD